MRADAQWQEARAIPRMHKQERSAAFARLRQAYGFSAYALHAAAKDANCAWIADHIDATMAQTLATRAYRAVNRVCLGQAKQVRFRSKGRGMGSVEGKRNDTGMRFVLQQAVESNQGGLLWGRGSFPRLDRLEGCGGRLCTAPGDKVCATGTPPGVFPPGTRGRWRRQSVFRAGDRRGHTLPESEEPARHRYDGTRYWSLDAGGGAA